MNRALALLRIFVAVACLSPLVSLAAGDRYRVTLTLYPGDDSAAIAKRLAAAYQGQLETAVDERGTFEITLSTATADLLGRDPQVAQVGRPGVTAAAEVTPNAATSWTIGNFGYDDAGNIKKIGTAVYVYDSESRLESEKVGTQTHQALTYDGFGNILSITEGSTSFTVGSDDSSNRATVSSSATNHLYGTYDGAGNMTSMAARTYTYDALNVMTKSTTDVSRAYVYNANDERIGTIVLTAPNGTEVSSQWTIRDPAGQVLRRFWKQGSNWQWMQDYIYRDGKMLASESNDQFKTLHYHLDHLGTPRLVTGNGGVEVARHTYYPFGEEAPGTTPQVAEPKKFTGHERDPGGVDYMHARFYDYSMGRFLSIDPTWASADLGRPQSWNRYAYVLNNPVNMTDPDGKCPICIEVVLELLTDGSGLDPSPRPDVTKPAFGGTVTRYMGAGEADWARRNGFIPNTDAELVERPTHVTTDEPVDNARTAKKKYELKVTPTHRATVPQDRVPGGLHPTPDGRPQTSGGGSQSAATRPIPVKESEIVPLKPGMWKRMLNWIF